MAKRQYSHPRNQSVLQWSAESWAFLTLRLFLALRFIVTGLGKFQNSEGDYAFSNLYDGFVASQIQPFSSKTNLPAFLSYPYIHSLAYVEIVLGTLLLLGIRTKHTLALTAMTYVSLAYGMMLLGNNNGISSIGTHLLLTAAALYFVRHNKIELVR
jgi:uncharacterized membrane protein YphA (DoxX/SURF4 family)